MGHRRRDTSGSRFSAYVEGLVSVIGHADRARPLRDYCMGLMMPCERKSVEPMAAVTAPGRVAAQHQSLLHFVGEGRGSDEKVLAKVRALVVPEIERHGVPRIRQDVVGEVDPPDHVGGITHEASIEFQPAVRDNTEIVLVVAGIGRGTPHPVAEEVAVGKARQGVVKGLVGQLLLKLVLQYHLGGLGLESLGDIHYHDAYANDLIVDSDRVPTVEPVTRSTGALGARARYLEVHDCLTSGEHLTIGGFNRRPEFGSYVADFPPELVRNGAPVDSGEPLVETLHAEVSVNKSESNRSAAHQGFEEGQRLSAGVIHALLLMVGSPFQIEGKV